MSYLIAKNERLNKLKAAVVTITICSAVIGSLILEDKESLLSFLPDTITEYFIDIPVEQPAEEVAATDRSAAPRP